jgi:hypothetical protein
VLAAQTDQKDLFTLSTLHSVTEFIPKGCDDCAFLEIRGELLEVSISEEDLLLCVCLEAPDAVTAPACVQ